MSSKGIAVLFAIGTFVASSHAFAQITQDYRGFIGIANAAPGQRLSVGGNLEVADVAPGAVELSRNGVDWTSGGGGIADQWSTWYWTGAGGSVSFVTSIVTGNGFTGNAQKVLYNTVTGTTGGKLTQALTFLKDHQYRISFKYRSSTSLQVVLGDNEGGAVLPANNTNTAVAVTLFASPLIQDRPALDFYSPGGGAVPTPGTWFEIDDVSVKEATIGNAMVRGLITGGGANGIRVDLAGNVGVGGDPFHKLDVAGNMTVGAGYRSVTTVPVDGMIVQGKVGIGTQDPATPLDVNGAATLRSTLAVTGSASFANGVNVSGPFNASGATLSGPMTLSVPSTGTLFSMTANGGASTVLYLTPAVLASYANLDLRDGGGTSRIYLPAYVGNAYFKNIGNVGIGVTNPTSLLSNTATNILDSSGAGINPGAICWRTNQQGYGLAVRNDNTSFTLANGMLVSTAATDVSSYALSVDSGVTPVSRFAVRADGQVRIGGEPQGTQTTDKLVVNGTIRGSNVIATYQDVAEWVPATQAMPPGTVVVVKRGVENTVTPSTERYDTRVAGVVSAQPGVLLGIQGDSKAMIATTGRVKMRVDASGGSIEAGDLLVTSDTPGVAMRSEPIEIGGVKIHRPGTLVGKALEPLEGGVGEILVLLSLQ